MSALSARLPELRSAGLRGRLRIVRSPAPQRSLMPFVSLCLVILLAALLGALMLNTAMAATSYQMSEQRTQLARLSEHSQTLGQQVENLAAPANLATAAQRLGMERMEQASYLTLADRSIHGPAATMIEGD